jgi:hypothetical protein
MLIRHCIIKYRTDKLPISYKFSWRGFSKSVLHCKCLQGISKSFYHIISLCNWLKPWSNGEGPHRTTVLWNKVPFAAAHKGIKWQQSWGTYGSNPLNYSSWFVLIVAGRRLRLLESKNGNLRRQFCTWQPFWSQCCVINLLTICVVKVHFNVYSGSAIKWALASGDIDCTMSGS